MSATSTSNPPVLSLDRPSSTAPFESEDPALEIPSQNPTVMSATSTSPPPGGVLENRPVVPGVVIPPRTYQAASPTAPFENEDAASEIAALVGASKIVDDSPAIGSVVTEWDSSELRHRQRRHGALMQARDLPDWKLI